ncbi:MAG TPA: hypothetical protein PK205_07255 [Promineifilum sp.]|nr:hypothetical protein [Promineifilum sp.]
MSLNLNTIKSSERVIEIIHPATNEPVGIRFTIVSLDDKKLARLKRQFTDKRLQAEARGRSVTAEQIEENENTLLFAAITGWEWYDADIDGEKPEFNRAKITFVLNEYPWIKRQLSEEVGAVERFFGN